MRELRTESSQPPVEWGWEEIMNHLNCSEMAAKELLDDYHRSVNDGRYGPVEKHLILDFINQKQREEREREARHQANIAAAETAATLKEQVKTLKEMCISASAEARKSYIQSIISNFIAGISIVIALLALVLK